MGLGRQAFQSVLIPLAAVALLFAPIAHAGTRSIALHPLVVIGGEASESSGYAKLLERTLARRGVHPSHPEEVSALLAKVPSSTCHDDACLAGLARAAHADATLFV